MREFRQILWIWFLLWTAVMAALWVTGFGEEQASAWLKSAFLTQEQRDAGITPAFQPAMVALLRLVDPLWIILAAVNVYASMVAAQGLATARRWMGMLFLSGTVIAAASALTTWPLGPIHFTARAGWRLGPVSLGWVLLWCSIILGARELARQLLPRASHGGTAMAAGALAMATDLNLEPVAWKIRAFWLWYPGQLPSPIHPPLQNALTWAVGGALLTYLLRTERVGRPDAAGMPIATIILLLLNALCALAQLMA